jgi:hypothetical protein
MIMERCIVKSPSWRDSMSVVAKGATGRPVPLLSEFLIRRAGAKAG